MSACCWLLAAVAYVGFILAAARFLSWKWRPQVGEIEEEITLADLYELMPANTPLLKQLIDEKIEARHNDGS